MKNSLLALTVVLCLVAWATGEARRENTEARARSTAAVDRQFTVVSPRSPVLGAEALTIPQMLSYQGKLTDTLGVPVPDGSYPMMFLLYTTPSGGSSFWSENQGVTTEDGLFSVLLGSATPIGSIPDGGAVYLAMTVSGGPELAPRVRVVSSAYAYLSGRAANADLLQNKDTAAFAPAGHNHDATYVNEGQADAVSGAMLVDGTVLTADVGDTAVTMAKIAQAGATTGQVVKWTGSAWAPGPDNTGGGSGVTNVYQDTGIICVPNPITSSGNVKLDLPYGDGRYVNEAQSNSVTSAMITDGNVASADIRDTTITTAKLKDDAVTSAKVLDGGITSADIRDTTVNTADIKDAAVTMAKLNQAGATSGQVIKWTGSAWAPRNDSLGGGVGDSTWVRGAPDSVLLTIRQLGIARGGAANELFGTGRHTHSNFGSSCTTGASGLNRPYCTVGGGLGNVASGAYAVVAAGDACQATGPWSAVLGGQDNTASVTYASVSGGSNNYAGNLGAAVSGGVCDSALGPYSTVGGGDHNVAGDQDADTGAVVAGGRRNRATGTYSFVGGGRRNSGTGSYSAVAGGDTNRVSGLYSFIGGGAYNGVTNVNSVVGGGANNAVSGGYSIIGGGIDNSVSGPYSTTGGGSANAVTDWFATVSGGSFDTARARYGAVGGGRSNLAGDAAGDTAAVVAGGNNNAATGMFSSVGGGNNNDASGNFASVAGGTYCVAGGLAATVAGGCNNYNEGQYCAIGGGLDNRSDASCGAIAGGDSNRIIDASYSAIGGGRHNRVEGEDYGTVAGGVSNSVTAMYGAVGGGQYNFVEGSSLCGTIAGGDSNHAVGPYSVIGGGGRNYVGYVDYASVDGGYADTARADYGVVGGGYGNLAGDADSDTSTVIAGGWNNTATGKFNTIGGGYQNNSSNNYSTIAGGRGNTVNGPQAAVGGGWSNLGSGWHSAIAGGKDNTASGTSATVSGGEYNVASGSWSAVAGGEYNTASGQYAAIPGGYYSAARGSASLAAGRYACANHHGSFAWSDSASSASESVYTTGSNQFRARARGGTWFFSNAAMTTGAYLAPGSNSWESACDSMTKEDFRAVDRKALLDKVAALRVRDYKMKDQDDGTRHIGPVAQDFHNSFGYGGNQTSINLADADGVALAAIQALYEDNRQLRQEVEALKAKLAVQ